MIVNPRHLMSTRSTAEWHWGADRKKLRAGRRYWNKIRNTPLPRGQRRLLRASINVARQLPDDHVTVWRCGNGHLVQVVGPYMHWGTQILVRQDAGVTYGTREIQYAQDCMLRVVCKCVADPVTRVDLPMPRAAAAALVRLGGEDAMLASLRQHERERAQETDTAEWKILPAHFRQAFEHLDRHADVTHMPRTSMAWGLERMITFKAHKK